MRILSIVTVMMLLFTGIAFAADITPTLDQGTKTLDITGTLDTDTPLDFDWSLGFGFGYFVRDNLEVGLGLAGGGNDMLDHFDIGVYGKYNINTGSTWIPYLYLGGFYASTEIDDNYYNVPSEADFDTAVGKVGGGIAWFLRDNIALDARVLYNWAADNLWINQDGELQDTNVAGTLGLNFYFK